MFDSEKQRAENPGRKKVGEEIVSDFGPEGIGNTGKCLYGKFHLQSIASEPQFL